MLKLNTHQEYLKNVQLILNIALLGKAHFFKATNDFSSELAQLENEQAQDLASPALDWWDPEPMSEEQHFNQLTETNGALS